MRIISLDSFFCSPLLPSQPSCLSSRCAQSLHFSKEKKTNKTSTSKQGSLPKNKARLHCGLPVGSLQQSQEQNTFFAKSLSAQCQIETAFEELSSVCCFQVVPRLLERLGEEGRTSQHRSYSPFSPPRLQGFAAASQLCECCCCCRPRGLCGSRQVRPSQSGHLPHSFSLLGGCHSSKESFFLSLPLSEEK